MIAAPLEARVHRAVEKLEAKGPPTAKEVQLSLARPGFYKGWAYTTIKTVLDRMDEKGILSREKRGRRFVYRTVAKPKEVLRETLGILLSTYELTPLEAFRFLGEMKRDVMPARRAADDLA